MDDMIRKFCSFMGIFGLLQAFVPPALRKWLDRSLETMWEKLFQSADQFVYMEVEERPSGRCYNALYNEVGVYLSSLPSLMDTQSRLKVSRQSGEGGTFFFGLPFDEPLETSFKGAHVSWMHTCEKKEAGKGMNSVSREEKGFTLKYLKADRDVIFPAYLDYISKLAAEIEHKNAQRHLYTNSGGEWESTPFDHPSTFETLALEANLTDRIKADLDTFSKGEKFYHNNGRAWKRGYLLHGPPGTGKSSMIAAIANHLMYDVYDLELTKVFDNSELKSLLTQTTRKSIIVIEDIDCTIQFPDRTIAEESSPRTKCSRSDEANESPNGSSKLTLSGLLNFTDGLWSCCGEERIFIFTTNHRDRLDPALLRPGRMDMHILLSYCSFATVEKMASNYLGIKEHDMLRQLRKTILECTAHQVTPAAVAELLVSNKKDPDAALKQVMAAFQGSSAAEEGVEKHSSHLVLQEASPKKGVRVSIP